MSRSRSRSETPRGAPTTQPWRARRARFVAVCAVCAVGLAALSGVRAAEEPPDPEKALRRVLRSRLSDAERVEAAAVALKADVWRDPQLGFRAGLSLLPVEETTAAWLVRRATSEIAITDILRDEGAAALQAFTEKNAPADAATDARRAALGLLLRVRPEGCVQRLLAAWPPGLFVESVLRDEFGDEVLTADAAAAEVLLDARMQAARALDEADRDDATRFAQGLDALAASPKQSLPLLLHEVRRAAALAAPDGRSPRACRAATALGQLRDRSATALLSDCLLCKDGWLRHHAAIALGDIGDPAAVPALAWYLRRMSDEFRNRDQWDYPGPTGTPIPESEWTSTDYFVVDMMACDALLRLGVPNAAGFLIAEKLNPRKANSRIRVYQDAVDALLRAGVPAQDYNVDQGIPLRRAAFERLSTWWLQKRGTDWLAKKLDETDPGFVATSLDLAQKLQSNDARSFIITKRCCALIGAPMTPALLATLKNARKTVARTELAKALGVVRDARAVPALLGLLADRKAIVRETAVLALGSYVRDNLDAQRALLDGLKSRSIGIRVAALKALVRAPRAASILAAVRAIEPDDRDAQIARTVIELVQDGMAHWDAVQTGLNDPVREIRRTWWDLLQAALDLPGHLHDAQSPPSAANRTVVTREQIEAAQQAVPERAP